MSEANPARAPLTPLFDPLIPSYEYIQDPYPNYKFLRENQPMYQSPHGVWVATGHQEIAFLLKDRRFGRGHFYFEGLAARQGPQILAEPLYQSLKNMMLMKDGAEHRKMRGIIAKAFSHKMVEEMRPKIAKFVQSLIAKIKENGHQFDLIADFAFPLPSAVICIMLGIPESDLGRFSKRSLTSSRVLEPAPLSRDELDEQNGLLAEMDTYFDYLLDLRKKFPGDDLTTAFINAEFEGQRLTDQEIKDNIRMFFVGGQETTVNTIGNGLVALFRHPEQLQILRDDFSHLSTAILEMTRYDSSVQMTPRQALEDIEVGSARVARGETICCVVGSANRDPANYEDPEKFDVTRKQPTQVASFGGGPHYCIGAELGRIETEESLRSLLQSFPRLAVKNLEHPDWLTHSVVFRGLKSLPAEWHE